MAIVIGSLTKAASSSAERRRLEPGGRRALDGEGESRNLAAF